MHLHPKTPSSAMRGIQGFMKRKPWIIRMRG